MFSYNASCNLWNLAPWGRMHAWNFHTYTCTEPGKLDCREFLQGVGGMGCMHFSTHRLSLWKSRGNLTHIRKNLVFWISPPIPHFGSGVGSPHSRTQNVPFLLLSANMLVFVLFIVNSVWEQRTFTHLCHICSSFTRRTSFISRAAKSCWTCNWFLQPPVPWQVSLTSFSSETGGRTKVLACLWSCRKPLAVPGRKKRDFLTYSAAVLTWDSSPSWNVWV